MVRGWKRFSDVAKDMLTRHFTAISKRLFTVGAKLLAPPPGFREVCWTRPPVYENCLSRKSLLNRSNRNLTPTVSTNIYYTHKWKFCAEMLYFFFWLIRKIRASMNYLFTVFNPHCLTSMTHKWNPILTNANYSTSTLLLLSKQNFNDYWKHEYLVVTNLGSSNFTHEWNWVHTQMKGLFLETLQTFQTIKQTL